MSDNPFDYVKSIQKSKEDLIRNSESPEASTKSYNPWIVNKALSMYADSIMHSNEMNINHFLDKDMQYAYHLNSIRAMSRKHTWFKSVSEEDLDVICEAFKCNRARASEIISVVGKDNIDLIKKSRATGGTTKKK